jgi:hypothetical protein
MAKEWIIGAKGKNLKFKREDLLNYAVNRWKLNRASKVGATSELIRRCSPKTFSQWKKFYFEHAVQKKKRNGEKLTRKLIKKFGQELHGHLSGKIRNDVISIKEQECIDYIYNLVLNRTYEGHVLEILTMKKLRSELKVKISPASDEWDRTYNVDFYIKVEHKYIGLQIKPISSGRALDDYQWDRMHKKAHAKFKKEFGGRVFFVYSRKSKSAKKAKINNPEVIEQIRAEIDRLKKL